MVGALPHLTRQSHTGPRPRHPGRGLSRLTTAALRTCRPRPAARAPVTGRGRQLRRGPGTGGPTSTSRGLPGKGRGAVSGVPGDDRRWFGEELHHHNVPHVFGAVVCGGCGLWRLWLVVARCRLAAGPQPGSAVEPGEDSRCAGHNSCRHGPACPTVTRSIKPVRALDGSVDRLAVPKIRGNSRVSGRVRASFARVALGVGWV